MIRIEVDDREVKQALDDLQLAVEVDFVTKRPRRSTNVAVSGYLVEPDDIRNRIGNGEIEVVAGGVEW
jgi:hypothetical protein